jgi:hypothetical protein
MKIARSRFIGPLLAAAAIGMLAVATAFYFRPFAATSSPALLASDALVRVETRSFGTAFVPVAGASAVALVFYPDARVPPDAYAYLGRAAAASGHVAVILSFPLDFAIFAPARARKAIAAFPEVRAWIIGGHALGGTVAASYCASAPPKVAGLLLLAAFPREGAGLAASSLDVLCLSASSDGLVARSRAAAARRLLPSGTRYVEIAGGNHAQFGEYGSLPGDGAATVSAAVQRQAVIEETTGLMDRILTALR